MAIGAVFLAALALRLALLPLVAPPVPGVHDEFSYLLAGDTFAEGRLTNPPHPLANSFTTFHVNQLPTYHSIYPPAQGAVLALGLLAGDPWLGVLLSTATMVSAVLWMLQGWMPSRWALAGATMALLQIAVASYWVNSFWGGAVAATGGALLVGALPRLRRKWRIRDAFAFVVGAAILANSRPYEGLVLFVPAAAALGWWALGTGTGRASTRRIGRALAVLVGGLSLSAAFVAYYNWRLTGDPLTMPHQLNRRQHPAAIFLWQASRPPVAYETAEFDAFYNGWELETAYRGTWRDLWRVQREKLAAYGDVYFWYGGPLLLLWLPWVAGDRKIRFLLVALLTSAAGVFFIGWSLPHYLAPAVCVLYAVVVQCVRHARALRVNGRRFGIGIARATFALLVASVAVDVSRRARGWAGWSWNNDLGLHERAAIESRLLDEAGNHLVFVRYGEPHHVHQEWVFNRASIDAARIVWARTLDAAQNRRVLDYYAERRVWLVDVTDGGAELRATSSEELQSRPPRPSLPP